MSIRIQTTQYGSRIAEERRTYEKKKGVFFDPSADALVLKCNSPNDYAHFLKPQDRQNMRSVIDYLMSKDMTVELSGGVVQNHLMSGTQDYIDIDLLATTSKKDGLFEIVRTLSHAAPYSGNILNASGRLFTVEQLNMLNAMYMNSVVDYQFGLLPVTPIADFKGTERPRESLIHLSVGLKRKDRKKN